LRMIHIVMHIALQGSIAARRVRVEPTACLQGEVRRLLDRLHGEIAGRLEDDRPLPTDPRDNRRPILVIMATTGLAFLPPATRAAPHRLLATALRLPLVPGGVIEVIGFHGACQLAVGFIGEPYCVATSSSDSSSGHVPPALAQSVERNTTGTTERSRE